MIDGRLLYVLNEKGEPMRERNFLKWAQWFERADRHVGEEQIGASRVSSVFLGVDHNFCENGPPIVWETMVFGGPLDQMQWRCSGSREQAEAMHQKAIERVRESLIAHSDIS